MMLDHFDPDLKKKLTVEGGRFRTSEGVSIVGAGGGEVRFVLTPNVGTRSLGLTSVTHAPGQTFEPHSHPISEEVLVVLQGSGQFFLGDEWFDVDIGDVVFAPPGVLHGSRNPASNSAEFVTLGCASPPQLDLYDRVGYRLLTRPA